LRAARHRPALGIALTLLMAVCFAGMDNAVKHVGAVLPVLVILWTRYTVQAVVMALWIAPSVRQRGWLAYRPEHPRFQATRGLLLLLTSCASFFGVQFMPVAEFTAINMLTPVIVTLLAAWWLHERVSRGRWLLVIGGLVGALIVVRPGSGMFGWAVWLPLGGALSYACFQVITRRLASLEDPFLTHFWTGLVGSIVLALAFSLALGVGPIGLADIERALQPSMLVWLIGIGLAGTLGHLLLILALGVAPTSTLTPYAYAQIAFAAAIGWWAFGTVPDGWSWIGMGVIAACGAGNAWLSLTATSSTSTIEGCPSTSRSIPRTRKPAC